MPVLQPIVGFHQDVDAHWVAELACGHKQHVRHKPPFIERPWVTTEPGRTAMLGAKLDCRECADNLPIRPSETR